MTAERDTVKLSSKGQIVIPKATRDNLHLPPCTEFVISTTVTGLSITPKAVSPATKNREVRGSLTKNHVLDDEAEVKANIKARH